MCTSTSKNMSSQCILEPRVWEQRWLSWKLCIPAGRDAWICGTEGSCHPFCTFSSDFCTTAFQFSVQFGSLNLAPCETLEGTKSKKKKLLLLWLTIEKCFYSATAQINKTAWRVEGSTLKYMCHQQYYWTISICSLKQLRDLATAGVVFGGHQKFTLTYTFTLRNIKHLSFPPSNIICLLVDILVIIISLVTDSLLVFVYDFRAIDLVLIRILHWSLLRANKATFFYKRCLISRTSLFQWTAQYNILEAWCPVRTQCSNTFWFQIWH